MACTTVQHVTRDEIANEETMKQIQTFHDDLEEAIVAFEDHVQSMDIVAFNKI